jgi:S-formylglutathione hydrolase
MSPRFALAVLLALGMNVLDAPVHAQVATTESKPAPRANGARLERITVHGPSLVGNLAGDSPNRMVSIYLPPSYAKSPRTRYPVLYLLHGYTDSDANWFGLRAKHFVNVPNAVDRAFANGVREMIVVMPDALTKYGGSMYTSSVVNGNWEAFVTADLVSYIDKHYRTLPNRASRGLAGHSMGGYGTIRLGMKYPGIYSSLYAMSPCCMGATLEPPVEAVALAAKITTDEEFNSADFFTKAMLGSAAAWSPNPARPPRFLDLPLVDGEPVPEVIAMWVANAPLAMLPQYIPSLKSYDAIAVDAGDRDAGIADTVKTLDRMLTDYRIAHRSEIYKGDHVDGVEQRLEAHVLPFFSEHLKFK